MAGLDLPACPFCGGEAVVGLGSAYGQPTACVECDRCHTVLSLPGYNYLTGKMTNIHDAIETAARSWARHEDHHLPEEEWEVVMIQPVIHAREGWVLVVSSQKKGGGIGAAGSFLHF